MQSTTSDGDLRPRRPKVIYVMGAGRSGSTVLGVALGNCADVFFAGELDKWVPRAGEPKRDEPQRSEFWQEVHSRVMDPDVLRDMGAHRYLERSSALFRIRRRAAARRLRGPYRRLMGDLYDALVASAGTSYVVDTSHYPLRASELQALQGIDLYLVLLVRDPEDVVASFARDDVVERRFSPPTTRAYLLLTYLLSAWVFLKQPRERRVVLRYEDLLDDPAGVLRRLLDQLGSSAEVPDFTALVTGIPFHGNRLIDKEVIALQPPRKPAQARSLAGRLFAGLLVSGLSRLRPRVAARPDAEHLQSVTARC